MANVARDLFEQYRSRGIARIEDSLAQLEEEGPHLDFKENRSKSGQVDQRGVLDEHGRKVFAKAMSAFSNAGGGVIVWGLEAKNEVASTKQPIPNAAAFRLQLEEHTPKLVEPPLDGVEHIAIEDPDQPGAGYVVSYIPDGKIKPHMSTAKGQQTYFLRSGASSMPMPDSAVRAFVTSGARPSLAVRGILQEGHEFIQGRIVRGGRPEDQMPPRLMAKVDIVMLNDGMAMAEHAAVAIEQLPQVACTRGPATSNTILHLRDELVPANLYRLHSADPMYPGNSASICRADIVVPVERVESGVAALDDVRIRFWSYARDFNGSGVIEIPREKLRIVPLAGYHFP